ncbi:polysaccharide biosynthesis protein [Staphylococcus gallinarum]|uniref:polysaccharide biosynthesis protein n=1 Tax=Staphylococcus gallinarum TaxID=1293 RepID=UPI000D1E3BCA|nr:polysaccharide biosynthesis protein [Staphylococcus gallinarum]PTK95162.1 polysaccharide biosynthesis protein [Staphylococcus gallinarum]PTK96592.1 polysaccharide biosynthesis protein [Staphylococcus gallinarum]RIO87210.1 polysaccharide biosynthesis protein [Staphylococcus gallinarum]
MKQNKQHETQRTAFNGVVVLTVALIIVKVLSAIYRIPYQNILGDEGLYAYQQIYPIVALGVILTMNAIPSAVTQTFGSSGKDKQYTNVLFVLQIFSGIFFIMLLISAKWIAILMGDANLAPMLRAASFSYLFVGVLGVLRGYYQAQHEMNIPAMSQVIEQVVRVGIIMIAVLLYLLQHWSIYQSGMLAIAGSAAGFLASSLFLMQKRPFKVVKRKADIAWKQLSIAIVVFAVSQLIVIVWQVVDSFTVLHALMHTGLDFQDAATQKGIYDRGASFIQMGLIVTTTFSFVLIPLLTEAIKEQQHVLINRYANASIKITVLISVAAGIGLINLLPLMNSVFFKYDSLTGTLAIYMLTVICVSLIMIDIALLQVRQNVKPVFIAFIIGIICKALLNILLIPQLLMLGGSVSTVLSLIVFVILLHYQVLKHYKFQSMTQFVLKLIATMVLLTVAVQCTLFVISTDSRIGGLIELLIAAMVGIGVIILAIVQMQLLSYRELKHLPFGDKLYHMKRGKR